MANECYLANPDILKQIVKRLGFTRFTRRGNSIARQQQFPGGDEMAVPSTAGG